MAEVRVQDKENHVQELLDETHKLKDDGVRVGVMGSEGGGDLPLVASVHEFGATIPVTEDMKSFFWAKFFETANEAWKNMALTKKSHFVIPERPFIRTTIDSNQGLIRDMIKQQVIDISLGRMTAAKAVTQLGELLVTKMRGNLGEDGPPLSDVTVMLRRQGSSQPLRDEGRLFQGIQWERIA